MKTQHSFVAERALANHCSELLAGKADDAGAQDELRAEFATTLCAQFSRRLQPLLAGKPIRLQSEAGGAATASSLAQGIGTCAANFTLACGPAEAVFLVSFDLGTANGLTDRLFGGDGVPSQDEPGELSPSSVLALERLALVAAQAIGASSVSSDAARVLRHHTSIARLEPFPRGEYCLSWKLTAEQEGAEAWHMLLAAREADVDAMLSAQGGASARVRDGLRADPLIEPFAAIPLPLRAVLAEFKLPLAKLAAMSPGETIPIALARDVPLSIGQQVIARGKVGSLDDRIALRLVNQGNGELGS